MTPSRRRAGGFRSTRRVGVTVTSLSRGLTFHPLGPRWDSGRRPGVRRSLRWLTGRVPGTVRDYGQGLGSRGQLLDWPGQGPVPGPGPGASQAWAAPRVQAARRASGSERGSPAPRGGIWGHGTNGPQRVPTRSIEEPPGQEDSDQGRDPERARTARGTARPTHPGAGRTGAKQGNTIVTTRRIVSPLSGVTT